MKKVLALVLCLLMVAACFAGCASEEAEGTNSDKKDLPELVMGTNPAFPPYEMVDNNGKIIGIDAEIAAAIADKLDMKLTIKDMKFTSLIPAVSTGAIDMVLAGMTVTDERKQSVNFSESYATGIQVIIVKEDSDITLDNMGSKIIGVQSGTTGDIYCTDDYGQDHVKQYANGALATAALLNGQVDCVVIDNEPAKNFVASNKGLKILDTEYVVEDYAIAIAKDNEDLLKKVNKALAELKADGTINKIIGKYIKAE